MEDDILIDNYLKGLLSQVEIESFDERLKVDTDFNEKFRLEEQLFNTLNEDSWSFSQKSTTDVETYKNELESNDLQNLKETLTEVNSEFNSKSSSGGKRLFYYLAAASVVLFLGFQFFFNQSVSNEDLYTEYVDLNDLPSLVSRSNEAKTLAEAQNLFESQKYEDALVIFESQINAIENKGNVLIYLGISQIELGKYKDAEGTFNNLINSNLLDATKGNWYKALLFLKQDRVEDATKLLNLIVADNLFNKDKAQKLLKELH